VGHETRKEPLKATRPKEKRPMSNERDVLRELGKELADAAALPVHAEKEAMWCRLNRLERVRPMVWVNEICWNEFAGEEELQLRTTDPFWHSIEEDMRQTLYQWRHLPVDMIVEPKLYCPVVVHDTEFGIDEKSRLIFADEGSPAPSREFVPQIQEDADVDKIEMPEVSVDWEATQRNHDRMAEVFDGIIPVETRGISGTWFAPWDILIRWYGVQEAMTDLAMRPELVHHAIDRLVSAFVHRLDQWEDLGLLALNNGNIRIGSGGLGYTDELPSDDFDPRHVTTKDLWGSAMAQIFSEVSPAMHEEFALNYERRWLDRFGLTYYGCCEPLHLKLDILKKLPNLRKVSMSPWVNIDSAIEQGVGTDYVFSLKPNPAILAERVWDPAQARKELTASLEKTRGCVVEVIMKDISTVAHEPRRLWDWAEMAMDVVEEFA
jgi:hypothetical protein